MLLLNKLRAKNLLSIGNEFLEIDLASARKTLVVGVNGSGKSGTLLDAICLALYNRPFRKVSRAKLINSITNRGLLIECEFKENGRSFLIRRGIKPNIFEIYQDDKLIEPPGDSRDYQSWFEENILRINFRTFCQCVILGSRNYTPFLQLSAADRRQVVENILDIEVFSTMNTLLKSRLDESRRDVDVSDGETKAIEAQIELNRRRVALSQKDNETRIQEKEEQIATANQEYEDIKKEGIARTKELAILKGTLVAIDEERLASLNKTLWEFKRQQEIWTELLGFFREHLSCPTCSQAISEDFRNRRIAQIETHLQTPVPAETENEIIAIRENMAANRVVQEKITTIDAFIRDLASRAKENRWYVEGIQKDISSLRHLVSEKVDDITAELEIRKAEILKRRDEILRKAKVLSRATVLLKDGGVKARVIRQFIPWLNDTVNRYLDALDMFATFEMDEEFNEKIYSRGRDDFEYSNFSEGEKLRIDLALLFAWRELGRQRASASINLLIMDELLDSSLDADGADEFMKTLDTLADSENIIVISHRTDNIAERFERILKFEKRHNFTKLLTEDSVNA